MLLALSTRRGRGVCWGFGMGLGKVTSFSITHLNLHPTNHKLVSSFSGTPLVLGWATGNFRLTRLTTAQTQGKPPPSPYSILYVTPLHLHPNDIFSRFGLPWLWQLITPCSNLRLGWGLKQTCSSPWELSNGVSHSTYTHQGRVYFWLLVAGSQTANLTPSLSFVHNLCCRFPNGSCEAIFGMYASRPFQKYREHLKARCFDPCEWALSFRESWKTPKSPFRECECHPHTPSKWGCDTKTLH
jgi:hypothetical protein